MGSRKENSRIPAWSNDELDSTFPEDVEPAYFDHDLEAWVFSRHADVRAAFRSLSLCPASSKAGGASDGTEEALRIDLRERTMEALSPKKLRDWGEELTVAAVRIVDDLPCGGPVDIIEKCARPFCLALAAIVTDISFRDAEDLYERTKVLSASSAEPFDLNLREHAKAVEAEIRGCFASEHETLRSPAFVALAHTMQAMLANSWYALLQYPEQWEWLHSNPEMIDGAVEELLRYAGLARTLSRVAAEDVVLGGKSVERGQRIILRVIAANHDSEHFANANELDLKRGGGGHLTLGAGAHSCVAANLIRMAMATVTQALIQRFAVAVPESSMEWQGGSGFRYPKALWVSFSGRPGGGTGM